MSEQQTTNPIPPRALSPTERAVRELSEGVAGMAKLVALQYGGTVYQGNGPQEVCVDFPLETVIVRITRE